MSGILGYPPGVVAYVRYRVVKDTRPTWNAWTVREVPMNPQGQPLREDVVHCATSQPEALGVALAFAESWGGPDNAHYDKDPAWQ